MAVRTVLTKYAAELDASYKSTQAELKQSNAVLNSEMRKLNAQYKDTKDSAEYLGKSLDIQERKMYGQKEAVEQLRRTLDELVKSEGGGASITMEYRAKLNNAEAALYNMENGIKATREELEKASGSTEEARKRFSVFSNEAKGLGDIADSLAGRFGKQLPDGIKTSLNSMGQLNPAVALGTSSLIAFAAAVHAANEKLKEMTLESASYADEILTQSNNTSVSTQTLQEWTYAAELVDVSTDKLRDGLRKVTQAMGEASKGSGEYSDLFSSLSVSITDTSGHMRRAEDVFYDVVAALGDIENGTERDTKAMKIFGENAQDLNSLILQGRDGLQAYAEEAHKTSYVLTTEQLEALGAVDDAQQRLLLTQTAVSNQISAEYAPYMEKALTKTKDLIADVGETFTDSQIVESFGSILNSASDLIAPLGQLGKETIPALDVALSAVAGTLAWIADAANVVYGLFTLDFSRIGTALGYNSSKASNLQRWMYGADYKTSSYGSDFGWTFDESTGMYTGNGISYNASGNDNFGGGVSWVGENGPEKVFLPQGSVIANAQESRSGGDVYIDKIEVSASSIKEIEDFLRIAKDAQRRQRMGG